MKVCTSLCIVAAAMAMTLHPAHANDSVGVRQIAAPSKERGANLDVTVWYPAQSGGEKVVLGESVFFEGTPAMLDAPISNGRFPLILLSHGAGLAGNPQAISWIAAPLAKQGFVVAAPAHPGTSGKNIAFDMATDFRTRLDKR